MKSYCATHGSLWEPQALQMPYVNNLDLMVFPAMSKQYSALLSNHSNTVAKRDIIYQTTLDVWNSLDHSVIASGYVLAYQISKKIISSQGSNDFLNGGVYHSEVCNDYDVVGNRIRPAHHTQAMLGLNLEKKKQGKGNADRNGMDRSSFGAVVVTGCNKCGFGICKFWDREF